MGDLDWVWAEHPNPASGSQTMCVHQSGTTVYRYYHRSNSRPWTLIAAALDHRQAVDWYNHRVAPEVADAAMAARLDVLAAEVAAV